MPKCAASAARCGSISTSTVLDARHARENGAEHQPDHPAADHHDARARAQAGIPDTVERRLHIRREHCPARGQTLGQGGEHAERGVEPGLVRMQAEDRAPAPSRRPVLDFADGAIAVFHGKGKIAFLEGRAHALVFVRRYVALEDESFGPPG